MENHDSGFDTFEIDLSAVSWRPEESGFGSFGIDMLNVRQKPVDSGIDSFGMNLFEIDLSSVIQNQQILDLFCLDLIC